MKKISILLVDDHTIVREGMRALLGCETDFEVVAEAENGREAIEQAIKNQPDVVIMDLAMPYMNGAQATRGIVKACPSTKVLVVSSYTDDGCVAAVLKAGALGYLVKQTAAGELARAIREVVRGKSFFSPSISRRMEEEQHRSAKREGRSELTGREAQVLQHIADGFSNKEIAAELSISVKTVEKHRQKVMDKLNIHETAGLTRFAISHGLISEHAPVP